LSLPFLVEDKVVVGPFLETWEEQMTILSPLDGSFLLLVASLV